MPPRNSEDKNDNPRDDELLDFCKTNDFAIIDGRKIGDLFGKYTSHQYNGSSVIDLTITSFDYYDNITFFQVGDYVPWLSDHTPIFTSISLDIDRREPEIPTELHDRTLGYIWNEDSKETFKTFLSDQKRKLENANETATINSDANKLTEEIKNVLLEASKSCNLRKKKKQHKNDNGAPWFDKECLDLKKKITDIGKKLRTEINNKLLRQELFTTKKLLKKTVRKTKRLYQKDILKEMEQCSEQKKYWNLLKKLKQKGRNTTQCVAKKSIQPL